MDLTITYENNDILKLLNVKNHLLNKYIQYLDYCKKNIEILDVTKKHRNQEFQNLFSKIKNIFNIEIIDDMDLKHIIENLIENEKINMSEQKELHKYIFDTHKNLKLFFTLLSSQNTIKDSEFHNHENFYIQKIMYMIFKIYNKNMDIVKKRLNLITEIINYCKSQKIMNLRTFIKI